MNSKNNSRNLNKFKSFVSNREINEVKDEDFSVEQTIRFRKNEK